MDVPTDTAPGTPLPRCRPAFRFTDHGAACMTDKPIFVTQPHSPPLAELLPLLRTHLGYNRVLTNGGPFHLELEARL